MSAREPNASPAAASSFAVDTEAACRERLGLQLGVIVMTDGDDGVYVVTPFTKLSGADQFVLLGGALTTALEAVASQLHGMPMRVRVVPETRVDVPPDGKVH